MTTREAAERCPTYREGRPTYRGDKSLAMGASRHGARASLEELSSPGDAVRERFVLLLPMRAGLFFGREFELHGLAAHDVAEVMLPEPPVAREVVHQKLESQPLPERQQLHAHRNFPETRGRVITEAAMVRSKVAEAEAIEMILVRGIAKGTVVGIVRRLDP